MIRSTFLVLFLAGCSTPLLVTKGVADVIHYNETGQTLSDKVFSFFVGKDCSFLRIFQKKELCEENVNSN